ncbi:MFS transporter [uncultured Cohaesibacter sp.]|uniref:MFS transporter n=1 Tax=uncultured Cohaesibacter sp. TaxID=1002546 RepID=UPI002931385E|nr:MFS transporter [uncultured Cohaesibacter sp.]
MQFTFGVFLKPISQDMGWDRGTISLALNAGLVLTGLATPIAGRLMDRYGIRMVALPAILLFALATASVSFVSTSAGLFIGLYAVMGIAAAGQTPMPYSKAIATWFDRKRGLALGIAISGVGLGTAIVPKFAMSLIQSYGWREAYIGLGALTFILAFPAVLFFVRDRNAGVGDKGQAKQLVQKGLTGGKALRCADFWYLAVAFFFVALAANGAIAHVVPLLTDRGVSPGVAISALSVAGMALIGGRLISGYLLDRIFAPYVAAVFFLAPLAGLLVLIQAHDATLGAIGTVLIGVGLGAEVDLIAFLLTRYLGNRSFGEIYGYLFLIFMLGSGLGPMIMGVSFDHFGGYTEIMLALCAGIVIAVALMVKMKPYRFPPEDLFEVEKNSAASPTPQAAD